MKSTGIVRLVDELGRIVLPIELRRTLELNEGDPVEVFVDDEAKCIMLRKYRTQECLFCQSTETLTYFRERYICASCLQDLNPSLQSGLLESFAALDDGLTNRSETSLTKERQQRRKRGESLERLVELMRSCSGSIAKRMGTNDRGYAKPCEPIASFIRKTLSRAASRKENTRIRDEYILCHT